MEPVWRKALRRGALWGALALTVGLVYLQAGQAAVAREQSARHVPLEAPGGDYVSSRACRACHPQQYASWHESYHRSMTQPATPAAVRGRFSGEPLAHGAERVLLRQQAGGFVMDVLPPAAAEQPLSALQPIAALPEGHFPVKLVTGSHHMQVYWYETGHGRALGQVPFAYLFDDARWVPRHMLFLRPPELRRAGELGRWNAGCLHCHSTRAEPQLAPDGKHDTRVAELGIACEACHGPGAEHAQQMASPLLRYARHVTGQRASNIVNPAKLEAARGSAVCSQCHAIWQPLREQARARNQTGIAYRPGDDPLQTQWLFAPSHSDEDPRIREAMQHDHEYASGQFWSDGQARVSGREYNGMIESACMKSGELACTSCHSMHKAPADPRPVAQWADDQLAHGPEDASCVRCHARIGQALARHTHHDPSSPGSRCTSCHMPHTSWGLLKAMRSHRITSPSVQETLATGRPNACALCHLDRSDRWVAAQLQERFGVDPPSAGALAAPEHGLASGVTLALMGDAGQRALVAAALRRTEVQRTAGRAWMPAVLGVLLDDPYDAVRYAAGHALRTLPGFEDYAYDFVPRPSERPPVAGDVAQRAASEAARAARTEALPFTAEGVLDPERTRALLSRRDQRPVHLLE